jgi:hypothetical protein
MLTSLFYLNIRKLLKDVVECWGSENWCVESEGEKRLSEEDEYMEVQSTRVKVSCQNYSVDSEV